MSDCISLATTFHGKPLRIGGGYLLPVNTTVDGAAVTITTRYEAIGPTNIVNTAHFPMTVVLIEHEEIQFETQRDGP